jgi:hypothetical protein
MLAPNPDTGDDDPIACAERGIVEELGVFELAAPVKILSIGIEWSHFAASFGCAALIRSSSAGSPALRTPTRRQVLPGCLFRQR